MELKKYNHLLIIAVLLTGCGYYSLKGSLPAHIHSISVSPVINESTEFGVAESVETGVTELLISENILEVTGEDIAHSRLNITIKSVRDQAYTISASNSSEFEKVDEWRITLSAHVLWYDMTRNEPLFETDFSEWGAYGTGLDIHSDLIDNDNDGFIDAEDDDEFGSPRESALGFAIKKLTERIITEVTSTW